MPRGLALLVGLKRVDPACYGGWDGASGCWGCELDVDNMRMLLEPRGFDVNSLVTAKATKQNVLRALQAAAASLRAGDTFVFYYSGHGGQQPDANRDETDGKDETLVAYDAEIIDDDLNLIWRRFRPDVRIVMVSDSCNSGTNYRKFGIPTDATPMVPLDPNATIRAQMIHIGGCRDGGESTGYAGGGALTMALCNVFAHGAFRGTYKKFFDAVKAKVRTGQQPAFNEYGPVSESFRAGPPFTVTQARPNGRRGSSIEPKVTARVVRKGRRTSIAR